MTDQLTVKPSDLYRTSSDVAGLCKEFVVTSAVHIQGKKFVKVEGWQSIAAAHGCIPEIESVTETNIQGINGIMAWAVLRRMSDGQVISRASGFVGQDEKNWPERSAYARYAMAQTRATSRVCRNAFAFVVVMMNAGLETTPAEEVPLGGFDNGNRAPAALPPPNTDDYERGSASGKVGSVRMSEDGKCWFTSIGPLGTVKGESVWTRDRELADSLVGSQGHEVTASLRSKKPGSYQLISFVAAETEP